MKKTNDGSMPEPMALDDEALSSVQGGGFGSWFKKVRKPAMRWGGRALGVANVVYEFKKGFDHGRRGR